jgi:tetratricopeptide (TPR) repeat protein
LRARGFRGLLRVNERDWDGAKADFSDVIQTDPADATAYRGRAAVEMMDKDYEQGITDATTAIRLDPENAQGAYHLRAHGRVNLKDYAGAMADAFELVKLDPSNVAGYFARAEIRILCDDFSGASNDLQTALRMSPTNTAVYVCRAMLEQKCREPQAALADLGRMLALDPQSSHVPEIYEAMGYEQEDLHQWRPALKDFHKGMAYHSPPDGLRFQVFILRCRLGERPQALEDLDAYLHSLPASKTNDWTASIANFLAGHLDEKEFLVRATTTAKRPTDIADQICDAYYFEGMEHLLAGDKAGAGELFQKCLNTRQDNSYNYMNAVAELDDLKNH